MSETKEAASAKLSGLSETSSKAMTQRDEFQGNDD